MATVVGVVRDFRHYRLPEPMGPAVYFPYAVYPARQETIVIRTTRADPHTLVPALRGAVTALDSRLALYQVQTFDEAVANSLWRPRLQGNVLSIFAVLAVVLACTGLYGVISYAVAERTRELGVRMALGATPVRVVTELTRETMLRVAAGCVVGIAGAAALSRALHGFLFGVAPLDAATFVTVPLLLAATAALASALAAARAARIDPAEALRNN